MLEKIIGQPVYRGHCRMPDIQEWAATLCDLGSLGSIVIWVKDEIKLYLRYSQEDKELPIYVALGVDGCRPTGTHYAEPPLHVPTPDEIEDDLLREYREFYERLGVESENDKCRKEGCVRGAIPLSVYCRVHHFERYKHEPCPFHD